MADSAGGRQHELPQGVIADLDESDIFKSFTERTDERRLVPRADVLDGSDIAPEAVQPMQWPMLDDGKKLTTNAYGYPTGGWYALQMEKKRQAEEAAAEARRRAAEEAAAAEAAKEQEKQLTVKELEDLRTQAQAEGFAEGKAQGHQEGYDAGFKQGHDEGFAQGQAAGQQQGFASGVMQGQQQGFQQGQQQGIQEGAAAVTAQAERFRHLADMLANPLRELDKAVTDEIIYIISRLCKVILKRELKGDPEFLRSTVEKAVTLLPHAKEGLTLHLNADDLGAVEAAFGREYIEKAHWQLQADPNLAPGDVEAENAASTVSWRVDERIDALLSAFLTSSAPAVAQAARETIEGAPDYTAAPVKPLAPPPKLEDFAAQLSSQLQQDAAAGAGADPAALSAAQAAPAAQAQKPAGRVVKPAGAAVRAGAADPQAAAEAGAAGVKESPAMAARRRAREAAAADAAAAKAAAQGDGGLPPVDNDPFAVS